MLEDENNLKDSNQKYPTPYEVGASGMSVILSYTKSNRLVSALFMVTDILEKEEPIRKKLRTLAADIVSDIHSDPNKANSKIVEILSFLDIAFSINLISAMNANILKREFIKLQESIKEYGRVKSTWLEEFLPETTDVEKRATYQYKNNFLVTSPILKTPQPGTRLGVQKAGTLLKALDNVKLKVSDKNNSSPLHTGPSFEVLKMQRREAILKVLKGISEGLVITDIRAKYNGHPEQFPALVSCGEKTLQRELVSMVRDGVLKKTGEKRWSRYMAV